VGKLYLLHSFPEKVRYMKDNGFDIFNITNNQIMDMYSEGLNETLKSYIRIICHLSRLLRRSLINPIEYFKKGFKI